MRSASLARTPASTSATCHVKTKLALGSCSAGAGACPRTALWVWRHQQEHPRQSRPQPECALHVNPRNSLLGLNMRSHSRCLPSCRTRPADPQSFISDMQCLRGANSPSRLVSHLPGGQEAAEDGRVWRQVAGSPHGRPRLPADPDARHRLARVHRACQDQNVTLSTPPCFARKHQWTLRSP